MNSKRFSKITKIYLSLLATSLLFLSGTGAVKVYAADDIDIYITDNEISQNISFENYLISNTNPLNISTGDWLTPYNDPQYKITIQLAVKKISEQTVDEYLYDDTWYANTTGDRIRYHSKRVEGTYRLYALTKVVRPGTYIPDDDTDAYQQEYERYVNHDIIMKIRPNYFTVIPAITAQYKYSYPNNSREYYIYEAGVINSSLQSSLLNTYLQEIVSVDSDIYIKITDGYQFHDLGLTVTMIDQYSIMEQSQYTTVPDKYVVRTMMPWNITYNGALYDSTKCKFVEKGQAVYLTNDQLEAILSGSGSGSGSGGTITPEEEQQLADQQEKISDAQDQIAEYNELEQQLTTDATDALENWDMQADTGLYWDPKFIRTANWVRERYSDMVDGTPIETMLLTSMAIGIILWIIGRRN